MTFEQALERKNELKPYKKDGRVYVAMVVPLLQKEIEKWTLDYMKNDEVFTDETSKKYSSNNQFAFLFIIEQR